MVVGKFRVAKCDNISPDNNLLDVRLWAVYDENLPEDQKYATATPNGRIEMMVNNPAVKDHFQPDTPMFCVFMTEEEYRNFETARSQPVNG